MIMCFKRCFLAVLLFRISSSWYQMKTAMRERRRWTREGGWSQGKNTSPVNHRAKIAEGSREHKRALSTTTINNHCPNIWRVWPLELNAVFVPESAPKPLSSPAMRTYACEICPTHCLNILSFTFSTELYPPHPLILHPIQPPIPSDVCVNDPFSHFQSVFLFFPAVSCIFIFIPLYLIAAIPLSISFIPLFLTVSIPPSTLPILP